VVSLRCGSKGEGILNAGEEGYLGGQFLIAMPTMGDRRFERTVIYMCAHSASGAMGLVINRLAENITFPDLLGQLGIEPAGDRHEIRVHFGGPVEKSRGLVLHTADFTQKATMIVGANVALTASMNMLRAVAEGEGPRQGLLALGYAGWAPGQLEHEIRANGWLHAAADDQILFDADIGSKWDRAASKIGLDVAMLSGEAGHA